MIRWDQHFDGESRTVRFTLSFDFGEVLAGESREPAMCLRRDAG